MKSHCVRNKIFSLNTLEGVRLTEPEEIKQEILNYYVGLLGTPFGEKRCAYHALRLALKKRVSTDIKAGLIRGVTQEEIKSAMWSIKGDKAPGLDGYTSAFSQHN